MNIFTIYFGWRGWFKIKKRNKLNIVVYLCCSKRLLCVINCFTISICYSVYQFNDGANQQKESTTYKHTHKELIRRVTFEYVKPLTLKWPQNKLTTNRKKKLKKRKINHTYDICQRHFEIKLLISKMSQ